MTLMKLRRMRSSSRLATRSSRALQRGARVVELRVAALAAGFDDRLERLHRLRSLLHSDLQLARETLAAAGDLGLALMAGARVEARLEQLHQQPRQQRIAREGLFDVGLRERHADLQQVLAVAAQHRHLAPGQAGRDDQPVEAVVLGIAAPELQEGLLEGMADRVDVEIAGARLDLEILQVDRAASPIFMR